MIGVTASSWRWAPALGLLIVLVYGQTLTHGFHFDDDHTIVHNPSIRSPVEWSVVWSDPTAFSRTPGAGMFRPLLLSSFVANYWWSGLDGWSWHAVNVALHALVSMLVVLLARDLGCREGPALAAGVLFGLHPLAVEPVRYISSRSESLATLFLLLCILGHIRGHRQDGTRLHRALSLGALAAGLCCKATAATAPLLIAAYELSVSRAGGRKVARRTAPTAVIGIRAW